MELEAQGTQEQELEVEEFELDEDEDIFDELDDEEDESDDETEGEPIPAEGMKVTAKKTVKVDGKNETRAATLRWHPGDDLDDAVNRYGAETVYTHYLRNAKIKLQGVMRNFLENGVPEDKIREELDGWRPDEDRSPSKDPLSRIMGDWNKLDDDERQRVKEMLGL